MKQASLEHQKMTTMTVKKCTNFARAEAKRRQSQSTSTEQDISTIQSSSLLWRQKPYICLMFFFKLQNFEVCTDKRTRCR